MSAYNTVIQVRFGHVDPAGIAYFPRIFDYLHDVFEEVWEEHVGTRYYHLLLEQSIGFPLVHSEVDFKRPLRFGDRPVASVTCFRIGRTSLGLRYRFLLGDEVHVDARMITVCTDTRSMEPLPIPEEFRRRFELILEPEPDATE
ncbi:MAG: thioesterase family protein [Planctomycetota bacterium]